MISNTTSAVSAAARSTCTPAARPISPARCRRRCTATSSALVQGGYSAQEIIDAFVDTYGERVLMAPRKSGFNLVGMGDAGAGARRRRRSSSRCCCGAGDAAPPRSRRRVRRTRRAAQSTRRPTNWRASKPRSKETTTRDRGAVDRNAARRRRARVRALSDFLRRRAHRTPSSRASSPGSPTRARSGRRRRLREIEFDRATGKLSDDDYAS